MKKNLNLYIMIAVLILILIIIFTAITNPNVFLKKGDDTDESSTSEITATLRKKAMQNQDVFLPGIAKIGELVEVPDFTLTSLTGKEISFSDYEGKVVILNFWASWCPPCKAEMPGFERAHKKLDPDKAVILAINVIDGIRETEKKARNYINSNEFTLNVLLDKGQEVTGTFGIDNFPTTVFINPNGTLFGYKIGPLSEEVLLMAAEKLYSE
jgi:thiol-disulfide isomerase/thioredoxin